MKYLGGKARIGARLAPEILQVAAGRPIWEAFCGGCNVTWHLKPDWATDAHPALIGMYQALYAGWDPPTTLSKEEWEAAKTLPDNDPLKAFAGFGCSFSGMWFSSYAGEGKITVIHDSVNGDRESFVSPALGMRKGLLRLRERAHGTRFAHVRFMDVEPYFASGLIYCDPPYAGTTGYSTGTFDHDLFWRRCQEWVQCGVDVLVSEYACPVPHELIWSLERKLEMRRTEGKTRVENLFKIL